MDRSDADGSPTDDVDVAGSNDWSPEPGFGNWTPHGGTPDLSGSKAVAFAFGLAVSGFLVAFLVGGIAAAFVDPKALSTLESTVLGLVILQGISFPAVALGYLRLRGLDRSYLRIRRPSLRDVLVGVGGFALAFTLIFASAIVISLIGAPTAERADSEALQNPQVVLTLIPLSLLVIGPGEELLFRGAIQSTLRESFSAPAAIVLANFAFAPAHILALIGSLQALAVTISLLFIPGLVFGAVYEYSENLVVPSLSHGLYNATLFGITYLVLTSNAAVL